MGHHITTLNQKNYTSRIETKSGKVFKMTFHSLVEHIFLLRQVIHNPQMTEDGEILTKYIDIYCQKMSQGQMQTAQQQVDLPWQVEWIWHVHRLHPLNYLDDCTKQLQCGLIDKQITEIHKRKIQKFKSKIRSPSKSYKLNKFIPSIDLKEAIFRQKDFLKKFQNHILFNLNLKRIQEFQFQNLIQDYVSFIKLADQNQIIVPTFDIDLIWHTHMRYPSHYHGFTRALCGFILDHNDDIQSSTLSNGYEKTAQLWKDNYQTEYGQNVNRQYLMKSKFASSCAVVFAPIFLTTNDSKPIHPAYMTGCATAVHYDQGNDACTGGNEDGGATCGGGGPSCAAVGYGGGGPSCAASGCGGGCPSFAASGCGGGGPSFAASSCGGGGGASCGGGGGASCGGGGGGCGDGGGGCGDGGGGCGDGGGGCGD
mgnify:FL=1